VSTQFVLNQGFSLTIPAENSAEHLPPQIMVSQVGVIQDLWMAIRNVSQPCFSKFEQIHNSAVVWTA
jgi:hypothetical protein